MRRSTERVYTTHPSRRVNRWSSPGPRSNGCGRKPTPSRKLKPKDETHRKHTYYVPTDVAHRLLCDFEDA
ncbi:DUF2250 domain-containing protein [Natronorubrum sp. FCH18a]|uniref:DUF2250 domain-containing protein n=1 Tax=Natronorubrum sp. FCH18a TaxID=3447018 RepID=UPI003F5155EB